MDRKNFNLEVLAPAGDLESFKTAIYNGANAIYLGVGTFNARLKANEINLKNLRECVKFAHLFGVSVYLTVNTLVKDQEIDEFIEMIKTAVDCKVDAFIVQDFGVAKILKNNFSGLVLHASTQMGIHNLKGAKIAEDLGFSRVVVSRETKLQDIIDIKNNTNLEIEYFVQGALCVAFSGNCYLSSILANKSGNRGECLQLCRLPYIAELNGKQIDKGYLLSPSDLCLISKIKTLIESGVCSFKIEGRLRRAGYVGQAVSSFRFAIDNLNTDLTKEISKLSKVFNRGSFNQGLYLEKGVPDSVINKRYNNHKGIEIGRVVAVKPFKDLYEIEIESNKDINQFDGLKFFRDEIEVASLGVGNVNKKSKNFVIYSKQKVDKFDKVFKTVDYQFEQLVLNETKKISIDILASAIIGKPLKLTAKTTTKNGDVVVSIESVEICQEPINKALSENEIVSQINKLNDTEFELSSIELTTDGVFLSKSIINQTRRDLIEKLKQEIINKFESENTGHFVKNFESKVSQSEKINNNIFVVSDIKQLNENIDKNRDIVVISPSFYSFDFVKNIYVELTKFGYKNIGLNLPIVCNFYDTENIDEILSGLNFYCLVANNIWGLSFVNTHTVIAGTGLNVTSNNQREALLDIGVSSCVKSVEQISSSVENSYKVVSKNFPLMTFCHCPYKTVNSNDCSKCSFKSGLSYVDNKNRKFNIRRYNISQCYFELLNNIEIGKYKPNEISQFIDLR